MRLLSSQPATASFVINVFVEEKILIDNDKEPTAMLVGMKLSAQLSALMIALTLSGWSLSRAPSL